MQICQSMAPAYQNYQMQDVHSPKLNWHCLVVMFECVYRHRHTSHKFSIDNEQNLYSDVSIYFIVSGVNYFILP